MIGVCLIVILIALLFFLLKYQQKRDHFGEDDHSYALAALSDLDAGMIDNRIDEVDDEFLKKNAPNVYMVKMRDDKIAAEDAKKEYMTFFNPVNTQYWPYYFYSDPYKYQEGGAWPPGMKSRLYNWQPGFETSGWSYWLRPGVTYSRWPRSRWVKQNGSFYFINNGSDRSNDYTGDPS